MEYPYYNLYVPKATLRDKLQSYAAVKPRVQTRDLPPEYLAIARFEIDTPDFDVTTDWFVEPHRVKCHKIKWKTTPLQQFASNRAEFERIAAQSGMEKAKLWFANKHLIECDIFPAPVAYWIYRLYKPRKILDMCAGWGDRLCGAILYDPPEGYTGVDPNSSLHPEYARMIEHYAVFQDKSKYNMIDSKFEDTTDADLGPDGSYNLMFTSPPYFSAEQHTDKPFEYGDVEHWLSTFMFPSLDKTVRKLAPGGRIVMAIGDLKDIKYVDRIKHHLASTLQYEGIIEYTHRAWRGRDIKQSMYVWYKPTTPADIQRIVNPPIVCRPYPTYVDGRYITINVCRDDYVSGGTKIRAALKFLQAIPDIANITHIVYRGPTVGAAQIALAVAARLMGKQAINILNYWDQRHENTDIAAILGSQIIELRKTAGKIDESAVDRALDPIRAISTNSVYMIPLGFEGEEFRNMLISSLKEAAKDMTPDPTTVKTVWVVSTTGNLLRSLYELFPTAHFNAVLVGFQDEDYIDRSRTTIRHVPESFYQEARVTPPYPSTSRYDAKIWQFIAEHGQDGDTVWNVA